EPSPDCAPVMPPRPLVPPLPLDPVPLVSPPEATAAVDMLLLGMPPVPLPDASGSSSLSKIVPEPPVEASFPINSFLDGKSGRSLLQDEKIEAPTKETT